MSPQLLAEHAVTDCCRAHGTTAQAHSFPGCAFFFRASEQHKGSKSGRDTSRRLLESSTVANLLPPCFMAGPRQRLEWQLVCSSSQVQRPDAGTHAGHTPRRDTR